MYAKNDFKLRTDFLAMLNVLLVKLKNADCLFG